MLINVNEYAYKCGNVQIGMIGFYDLDYNMSFLIFLLPNKSLSV